MALYRHVMTYHPACQLLCQKPADVQPHVSEAEAVHQHVARHIYAYVYIQAVQQWQAAAVGGLV